MKSKNTFNYGGIILDTINSQDSQVPSEAIEITLPLADKKALAIAIKKNLPALLIGETGTGKTSIVRQLAFLRQQGYTRLNGNGYATPDEWIGSKSVKEGQTYYENGIVTNAMIKGHILVIDEINAVPADCTFILHGLLDEDRRITLPNGDIIIPHKDFRVFATCNPDYEGTRTMNKAFIDRFPIILAVDTLSPTAEQKLLIERFGIDSELAKNLVTIASIARKSYAEGKISTYISTRALLNVSHLIKEGLDSKSAFNTTIAEKATNKEEKKILQDFYNAVLKVPEAIEARASLPYLTTYAEIDNLKKDLENGYTKQSELQTRITELEANAGQTEVLKDILNASKIKVKLNTLKIDSKLFINPQHPIETTCPKCKGGQVILRASEIKTGLTLKQVTLSNGKKYYQSNEGNYYTRCMLI